MLFTVAQRETDMQGVLHRKSSSIYLRELFISTCDVFWRTPAYCDVLLRTVTYSRVVWRTPAYCDVLPRTVTFSSIFTVYVSHYFHCENCVVTMLLCPFFKIMVNRRFKKNAKNHCYQSIIDKKPFNHNTNEPTTTQKVLVISPLLVRNRSIEVQMNHKVAESPCYQSVTDMKLFNRSTNEPTRAQKNLAIRYPFAPVYCDRTHDLIPPKTLTEWRFPSRKQSSFGICVENYCPILGSNLRRYNKRFAECNSCPIGRHFRNTPAWLARKSDISLAVNIRDK